MLGSGAQAEITVEANLFRANFPEFFAAAPDTNWQPVILDKACEMPQAAEDYAGAACTGTEVEPNRTAATAGTGEDHHGFEPAQPEGNLMTIVLELRLSQEDRRQAIGGD